jgi:NADH-quinone oxidoreductase subunit G
VLIPASTFAEADGTMVNNEGRAQRFYQSFVPSVKYIKESWKWLAQMKTLLAKLDNHQPHHPEEWLEKLEKLLPQFKGITQAAPPHDFRIHKQLIPREPHRYSGRTAMLANKNVNEPKPLQDDDSPLTFTMEGYKGIPPGPMIPFFWSPGWNSVQSVAKYQEEVGGSLRGGSSGVRLFKEKKEPTLSFFKDNPEAFMPRVQKWLLLPQYDVFGSGELSIYTNAIEELSPEPYIALSKHDMELLKVTEGSIIEVEDDTRTYSFPAKVKPGLCNGIVLVSAGLRGMDAMNWGTWVKINLKI